jgi:hypothetical protein
MDDSRDLSWLGRAAPPPAAYPEAVVWRVEKDTRWAEARVRQVPHGHELRIVAGGAVREPELMQSTVYAPSGGSAELAQMSTGTLNKFLGHGWHVAPGPAPTA